MPSGAVKYEQHSQRTFSSSAFFIAMKKLILCLAALICAFSFTGCAQENGGDYPSTTEESGETSALPPKDDLSDNGDSDETAESGSPEESGENLPAYTTRTLSAERDGNAIYALLYLPYGAEQSGESYPAVILSHSAMLTADSLADYCIGFARRGFIACALDFCGGSSSSRSEGSTEDMTIFTECEDLNAVLNAVKSLPCVDGSNVTLFGTSQGGLVSALVADERADEIARLILLYPAFSIPEQVASFYGNENSGFAGIMGSLAGSSFFSTGEAFVQTLIGYDAYAHIGKFENEVLILHGTKDFIVDPSYSARAAEIYKNCRLYLIEGASHGFNRANYSFFADYDEEVWGTIDCFLGEGAATS